MRRRDPDEITRSFRINRELWQQAMDVANARGESLSEEMRKFLTRYVRRGSK